MLTIKDSIWTWLVPDGEREINRKQWPRHGGKWIVFARKDRIVQLAKELRPFIDSGEIVSAKYWNGDPSAINVYSLDRDRDTTGRVLEKLGAGHSRVWEYDYAWDKNICSPLTFTYSWFSKFRTIFQSYGVRGAFLLLRKTMGSDTDPDADE
ncbi:MAG TPA: hypothetical protein DCO77_07720 [Nitrospiraceae bacterium]|nr:hypothetical protein [Nitrospiraceae bacterium]